MKPAVPSLSPLLRSNTQGDILALLYLDTTREWSLADLSRLARANPSVVHREVERLVAAGVASERRVGRSRLISADRNYFLTRPLEEMVLRTYGPLAVLSQLLLSVPGITSAYIYGSWAARYEGEIGAPPRDIDVLVVGSANRSALEDVADEAGRRVRTEVNVTRVSQGEWTKSSSAFLKTVRERPLVEIPLDHDTEGSS